jgi:ferredoxin
MKVRIDAELCQGHLRCLTHLPEVFDADEQGYGAVLQEDVPPDLEAGVREAVALCPEQAIVVED